MYVLIAILFFLILVMSIGIGISNKQKIQVGAQESIKQRYETDIQQEDQVYDETIANQANKYVTLEEVETLIEQRVNQKILAIYPVGSIYLSTNDINPGQYIGGTWEAYAPGRTIIGVGKSDQEFTFGMQGGKSNEVLTIDQIPSHSHTQESHNHAVPRGYFRWKKVLNKNSFASTTNGNVLTDSEAGETNYVSSAQPKINNTGGSNSHNNLPPYVVTYMWKRVK